MDDMSNASIDLAELLTGEGLRTELVRLVTCGSVDDGKSTLIGRLLFDTKQVFVDQMEHVEETSERRGDGYVNLALLTDGLRAEREQGITIDVAYRSFITRARRFQLADAPGPRPVHAQHGHRRLDGRRRHRAPRRAQGSHRADAPTRVDRSALGVPHVVYAVNKMDLVDHDERASARSRSSCASSPAGWAYATRSRSRSRRCTATTSSSRSDRHAVVGRAGRCSTTWRRSRSQATATPPTVASRCSGSSARCPTSTTTTAATRVRSRAASGVQATRWSCSRRAARRVWRRSSPPDGPARRGRAGHVGRGAARGRPRRATR